MADVTNGAENTNTNVTDNTKDNGADLAALQAELEKFKAENEKLKEKGETLELDENGNIKGLEERLSGLKTQFPSMFESAGKDGYQVLGDNRLPGSEGGNDTITKEDFAKMGYKSRVELKASNPELYSSLIK